MKVDVVLPLSCESKSDNLEARIMLRSLDRFAQNLGTVWVLTPKPPRWLRNCNVLPCEDPIKNNKDANIINKVRMVAKQEGLSDKFLFASDDQVLTQQLNLEEAPVVYNIRGPNEIASIPKDKRNHWHKRLLNTFSYIQQNYHHIDRNYEAHTFQPYDKNKVELVFANVPYETFPGLTINTTYYGVLGIPPNASQADVKLTFEQNSWEVPNKWKLYAGYNDQAFNAGFGMFLLGYFFGKSKFEA